jgi:hypothetical protein
MKFFLDNCLAVRHARALNEMVKPEHSFTHLQGKFAANTKDEDWIRALRNEGGWIVLSGDYRVGLSPHERKAWHESGLTAFFLSKGWTNIPPLQQHSKLALMLAEIIEQSSRARPGTGFSVSLSGKIQQVFA